MFLEGDTEAREPGALKTPGSPSRATRLDLALYDHEVRSISARH